MNLTNIHISSRGQLSAKVDMPNHQNHGKIIRVALNNIQMKDQMSLEQVVTAYTTLITEGFSTPAPDVNMYRITADQIGSFIADTLSDYKDATIVGIRYEVCSQTSFDEGITDGMWVVFITHQKEVYNQYGVDTYSNDGGLLDNFDHDEVRDFHELTAREILDKTFTPDGVEYLKSNNLKFFWGSDEIDLHGDLDDQFYTYGEDSST